MAKAHTGPVVFKSCNIGGLAAPENLKNRGVEHFAALAERLSTQGRVVVGSVVGASEAEIVEVASRLDRARAQIIELNLADDYVTAAVAPFASLGGLGELLERVRGAVRAVLAVKLPPWLKRDQARPVAELFRRVGVGIAVCWNDLPKGLAADAAALGAASGVEGPLSQVQAFYLAAEGAVDVVAVGGVSSGREAYNAHLTGAKAVQVGSALFKEGLPALDRIDGELDALLAEAGVSELAQVVGRLPVKR